MTTTSTARRCALALAFLLSAAQAALAELPPEVYLKRQKAAPEALRIKVVSVKKKVLDGEKVKTTVATIEAHVLSVERSATKLKPGSVIRIEYVSRESKVPMPGPSQVPLLVEGREYPAYLSKNGVKPYYIPAAGGWSFERVKEGLK